MIKKELIKVKISRHNIKEYYEQKGYHIDKIGQEIIINAQDITYGSKIEINYICDYCGKEFKRTPCSNRRSKITENQKDACTNCKRLRTKETCLQKYEVDNPMKVEEIQIKCEKARAKNQENFKNSKPRSCSFFVNGIPVSAAQSFLQEFLPEFQLNYHLGKYYIDLFKDNICIEYDERGHDMEVRMGKITRKIFIEKEKSKKDYLLSDNRLLKIIDLKDKWKDKKNIVPYLKEIKNFIENDELYKEIIVN